MTPINNSDTAWLIVSDFNQDNDLPYEELREDIINPEIDQWFCEGTVTGVGTSGTAFLFVADLTRRHVGCQHTCYVGSSATSGGFGVGGDGGSDLVGGRYKGE